MFKYNYLLLHPSFPHTHPLLIESYSVSMWTDAGATILSINRIKTVYIKFKKMYHKIVFKPNWLNIRFHRTALHGDAKAPASTSKTSRSARIWQKESTSAPRSAHPERWRPVWKRPTATRTSLPSGPTCRPQTSSHAICFSFHFPSSLPFSGITHPAAWTYWIRVNCMIVEIVRDIAELIWSVFSLCLSAYI